VGSASAGRATALIFSGCPSPPCSVRWEPIRWAFVGGSRFGHGGTRLVRADSAADLPATAAGGPTGHLQATGLVYEPERPSRLIATLRSWSGTSRRTQFIEPFCGNDRGQCGAGQRFLLLFGIAGIVGNLPSGGRRHPHAAPILAVIAVLGLSILAMPCLACPLCGGVCAAGLLGVSYGALPVAMQTGCSPPIGTSRGRFGAVHLLLPISWRWGHLSEAASLTRQCSRKHGDRRRTGRRGTRRLRGAQ